MNFELLCKDLGIHAQQAKAEQLFLLKQWFQEHLSHDQQISGTEIEQWEQYKEIIQSYFDVLEPVLEKKPEEATSLLEGESLLSIISETGLDSLLLKIHPNVKQLKQVNAAGLTPLHQVALRGWVHTAQALLSLGASPSVLNDQKQSPLFLALILPLDCDKHLKANKITLFQLLLEPDPSIATQQDINGDSLLHQMAIHNFGSLIETFVHAYPSLAYVKNKIHHFPIHNALLNGQVHNVKTLLTLPKVAQLRDDTGAVALHYAAQSGNKELIHLCAAKDSLDVTDFQGRTPLMLAAGQGHLQAVQALIKYGATVDLSDAQGWGLLDYATRSGSKPLIQWVQETL